MIRYLVLQHIFEDSQDIYLDMKTRRNAGFFNKRERVIEDAPDGLVMVSLPRWRYVTFAAEYPPDSLNKWIYDRNQFLKK